jgi:hypothetical protein
MEEIKQTIDQANRILGPLRGRVARIDKFLLFYLIIGIALVGTLAVIIGILVHFLISLFIAIIYISILIIVLCKTKLKLFEL